MILYRRRKLALFILVNAAVVFAAVAYVLIFYSEEAPITCRFKEVLHIYCPGCGGTRAVYYLLRFDFIGSFLANPAVLCTSLILADLDVRALLSLITNNPKAFTNFKSKVFLLIPAILILNFVIRNILLWEFGIDLLGDILA